VKTKLHFFVGIRESSRIVISFQQIGFTWRAATFTHCLMLLFAALLISIHLSAYRLGHKIKLAVLESQQKIKPTRTVSNLLISNPGSQAEGQKWRGSAKCPISHQ